MAGSEEDALVSDVRRCFETIGRCGIVARRVRRKRSSREGERVRG